MRIVQGIVVVLLLHVICFKQYLSSSAFPTNAQSIQQLMHMQAISTVQNQYYYYY